MIASVHKRKDPKMKSTMVLVFIFVIDFRKKQNVSETEIGVFGKM